MQSVLAVVRDGKLWAVEADGEVLALARTRKAATELAESAAEILRDSGAHATVTPEPRSFDPEDP